MNNTNFEQWLNNLPSGWNKCNEQNIYPLTIQQETSIKKEGNYSVKVTATQPHQGIEQEITSDMLGKTAQISVYVTKGYASLQLVKDSGIPTEGYRSPLLENPVVIQPVTQESPLNRTGVPIKCPNGDIIYIWIYGNNTNGEMGLDRLNMMKRSTDKGDNWSVAQELPFKSMGLPDGYQQYFVGGAYVEGNRVWLIITCHNNDLYQRRLYLAYSDDNCNTFSTMTKMFTDEQITKYGNTMFNAKGNIITLQSGTKIASLTTRDASNWANVTGWTTSTYHTVMGRLPVGTSQWEIYDLGYTPTSDINNGESALVELDNGSVKVFTRTNTGYFYESIGSNDGTSWTVFTKTDWATPAVNSCFKRLSDGNIFYSLNNYYVEGGFPRPRLTGLLADKSFKNPRNAFLIDQEYFPDDINNQVGWVSYPEIIELDNGNLLIFYDRATEESKNVVGQWFMEIRMVKTKTGWRDNSNDISRTLNQWQTLSKYIPSDTPIGSKLRIASIRDREAVFYIDTDLSTLTLSPTNTTLKVGETQQYTATGKDQYENVMDLTGRNLIYNVHKA